jgi:hypothetical protein
MPYSFLSQHIDEGSLCAIGVQGELSMDPIGFMRPSPEARESADHFSRFMAEAAKSQQWAA